MLIKVTALGYKNNISTVYFDSPQTVLVNPLKIWAVVPSKKGTEILDEGGRNTIIVSESSEEIYNLENNHE